MISNDGWRACCLPSLRRLGDCTHRSRLQRPKHAHKKATEVSNIDQDWDVDETLYRFPKERSNFSGLTTPEAITCCIEGTGKVQKSWIRPPLESLRGRSLFV